MTKQLSAPPALAGHDKHKTASRAKPKPKINFPIFPFHPHDRAHLRAFVYIIECFFPFDNQIRKNRQYTCESSDFAEPVAIYPIG